MGITKTEHYEQEQLALAQAAKALAHPARIAIIQHLLKSRQCINNDLVQELNLAQATISQHLKELKQVGLIQGTIEGNSMNYCINGEVWEQFRQQFNGLFDAFDGPQGMCC